jgi:hypothetical protein
MAASSGGGGLYPGGRRLSGRSEGTATISENFTLLNNASNALFSVVSTCSFLGAVV